MPSSGPNYPANWGDETSIGTLGWTNMAAIAADDGISASVNLTAGAVSYYLYVRQFGFALSGVGSIDGITAEMEFQASRSNGGRDTSIRLVKGGVISGSDYATGVAYSTSVVARTYGGAADLWGLSLSEADVEATNFGIVVSVTENAGLTTQQLMDYIRLTVTYTTFDPSTVVGALINRVVPRRYRWRVVDYLVRFARKRSFRCPGSIQRSVTATRRLHLAEQS